MKFLIVEPSPLPIRIPIGPKYSPQDPILKYPEYIRGGMSQLRRYPCTFTCCVYIIKMLSGTSHRYIYLISSGGHGKIPGLREPNTSNEHFT